MTNVEQQGQWLQDVRGGSVFQTKRIRKAPEESVLLLVVIRFRLQKRGEILTSGGSIHHGTEVVLFQPPHGFSDQAAQLFGG